MKKESGIHLYLNIKNYDEIIEKDERDNDKPIHAIHALDSFFTAIEKYCKDYCSHDVSIEKITGSRLHLIFMESISKSAKQVLDIVCFSYFLAERFEEIPKYKSLPKLKIEAGSAYGKFYVYTYKSDDIEEVTSIGFACNIAAKMQSIVGNSTLAIDDDSYKALDDKYKDLFNIKETNKLIKYNVDHYYELKLKAIDKYESEYHKHITEAISSIVNSRLLKDMVFSGIREKLDFQKLSMNNCKIFNGAVLFSDVRSFTKKFNDDDSNLSEMAQKTKSLLTDMYRPIISEDGVHVQFQGDREFATFNDFDKEKCCERAIVSAMRILDNIKNLNEKVGIAIDYGKLFATRFGTRGEKDNILLGKTVNEANILEDKFAGENEITISEEIYSILSNKASDFSKYFIKRNDHYYTQTGYKEYLRKKSLEELRNRNKMNDYNKAWSEI